ncbi:hypothetical protein QMK61_12580 [Fulvimonas sp. R45]|nr:hypothetical protein [Fulvimonas sp. R45]MDO1529668.1 hypothetical protein [Fulvimonas sp. R45]
MMQTFLPRCVPGASLPLAVAAAHAADATTAVTQPVTLGRLSERGQ